MEEAKLRELIGLMFTDLERFESEYARLHHTQRDEINPYLDKLDNADYMKQVKQTVKKWYYYVPPHSPPPLGRE
jgi:hypothetical protein